MANNDSWHRPHNHDLYGRNMERIYGERVRLIVNMGAWEVRMWEDWENGGFVASCPQIPGCLSSGPTRDDCLEDMTKAITEWSDKHRKRRRK